MKEVTNAQRNKYTEFANAVATAAENAKSLYGKIEDGGTCNLDMPILYSWKGFRNSPLVEAVEAKGYRLTVSKRYGGSIIFIGGTTSGQGDRRTKMAEYVAKTLKDAGYDAGVYYQID